MLLQFAQHSLTFSEISSPEHLCFSLGEESLSGSSAQSFLRDQAQPAGSLGRSGFCGSSLLPRKPSLNFSFAFLTFLLHSQLFSTFFFSSHSIHSICIDFSPLFPFLTSPLLSPLLPYPILSFQFQVNLATCSQQLRKCVCSTCIYQTEPMGLLSQHLISPVLGSIIAIQGQNTLACSLLFPPLVGSCEQNSSETRPLKIHIPQKTCLIKLFLIPSLSCV